MVCIKVPCIDQRLEYRPRIRYGLLGAAALSQGMTVGPLVGLALHMNSGIVVTAFLATAAVFACFSAAALVSRRRRYVRFEAVSHLVFECEKFFAAGQARLERQMMQMGLVSGRIAGHR